MTMEIFLWMAIGLIAGTLARAAMYGPRAGGIIFAMSIGLAGALIGGE